MTRRRREARLACFQAPFLFYATWMAAVNAVSPHFSYVC